MSKKQIALDALLSQKMLPLYYHDDTAVSVEILDVLYRAGVRTLEYTNRGEKALDNFHALRRAASERMPGLQLGIGTIKNPEQAKAFMDAGADFIVCPSIHEGVAKVVHEAGLLWIPGCLTPTEIAAAENAGASLVKVFPGNILGPSYISSIRDLFPGLRFMPTGGVEAETGNLAGWFKAGVVAVGMGSKLVSKERMEQKKYAELETATKEALEMIRAVTTTLTV